MAQSVLDRLQKANTDDRINGDVADRMYNNLMSDIRARAKEDARKEAQAELDAARAETLRVVAERDAAVTRQNAADELSKSLRAEVSRLSAELQDQKRQTAMANEDLSSGTQTLREKLLEADTKIQSLEVQLAEANGKLAMKPKQLPMPTNTGTPSFPTFDFQPVRGPDGRIQSVKAIPV